jgi:hypothetical protein
MCKKLKVSDTPSNDNEGENSGEWKREDDLLPIEQVYFVTFFNEDCDVDIHQISPFPNGDGHWGQNPEVASIYVKIINDYIEKHGPIIPNSDTFELVK